jgi:hypothetical protein
MEIALICTLTKRIQLKCVESKLINSVCKLMIHIEDRTLRKSTFNSNSNHA